VVVVVVVAPLAVDVPVVDSTGTNSTLASSLIALPAIDPVTRATPGAVDVSVAV
jgi:hypothetical protein